MIYSPGAAPAALGEVPGEYVVIQFYPWFKCFFSLFWGMVIYDNEFISMGNKI